LAQVLSLVRGGPRAGRPRMVDVVLAATALGASALGPAVLVPLAAAGGYWLSGLGRPGSSPAPPVGAQPAFTCACPPEGWPLWGLVLAFLLGGSCVLCCVGCSTAAAGLAWWWRDHAAARRRLEDQAQAPNSLVNRRRLAGYHL